MQSRNSMPAQLTRTSAPLRQQVVALMKEMIANGTLGPGERLVERALGETFGASRSTLREALRELEAEGLVTDVPGRGPIVTILSEDDIRNLYQVREVIEQLAIDLFIQTASEAGMAQLEADFAALQEASPGDSMAVLEGKTKLYRTLFQVAGNPVIFEVAERLQSRVTRIRLVSYSRQERVVEGLRELAVVIRAIRERDIAAARDAYSFHMRQALDACLAARRLKESSPDGKDSRP